MGTSVGSISATLAMGYDPSGLKLFKSDLEESRQKSVDMINGMSQAAGRLDPIMSKLSEFARQQTVAASAAERARVASIHSSLNASTPGQDFSKLNASLGSSDRSEYIKQARERDEAMRASVQAESVGRVKMREQEATVTQNILTTVRQQQAEALKGRLQEGEALRFQLLTEREKAAVRRQSDMEHLTALRRAGALSEQEFSQLSKSAGTLNLGGMGAGGGGKGANYAMMAQQVGFGIQDFSSQVMNSKNMVDGMGRGIMAVSNNVQMLGAAFGPTGLAVTAIGASVAGIVLPAAIKWLYNTEETEKATKKMVGHYETMADRSAFVAKARAGSPKDVIASERQLKMDSLIAEQDSKSETNRTNAMRDRVKEIERVRDAEISAAEAQYDTEGATYAGIAAAARKKATDQLEQMKPLLAEADKNINDKSKASREATSRVTAIQPAADIAKDIDRQQRIRALVDETSSSKVVSAADELRATQKSIESEIRLYEDRRNKATEADKAYLDAHIATLQEDRAATIAVIDGIQGRVDRARQDVLSQSVFERQGKAFQELGDQEQAAEKRRQTALESYGDEMSKLLAKQTRERRELDDSTRKSKDREAALSAQMDNQAVERARLLVGEKQKAIDLLGHGAGPSAGVDVNSSAGISAINRALAGPSEQDIHKQQLKELQNKQVQAEEIAKGGESGRAFKEALEASNGEAVLGKSVGMGSLGMGDSPRGTPGHNPAVDEVLNAKMARESVMGKDIAGTLFGKDMRRLTTPSPIQDVLREKREREAGIGGGKATIDALLAIKRATEEAAKKQTKVVALSG